MALEDVCRLEDLAFDSECILYKRSWRKSMGAGDEVPLHFYIPPSQHSNWNGRPFPLSHGTTTLAFAFQGGVIAAADTRASCAGLVSCPCTQKILPVHSHLVVTTSGSGADCMLWERILTRELRLYQLRNRRRLRIGAAAKLLSFMLHPFKGTDVCVAATLCGWDIDERSAEERGSNTEDPSNLAIDRQSPDTVVCNINDKLDDQSSAESLSSHATAVLQRKSHSVDASFMHSEEQKVTAGNVTDKDLMRSHASVGGHSGPSLCYVCSDGTFLHGDLISVGSGSPYAYAVLDDGVKWGMDVDEAVAVAREAVYRATHRDAYSGNNVDLFHITVHGWRRRNREDLKEEYYKEKKQEKKRTQRPNMDGLKTHENK